MNFGQLRTSLQFLANVNLVNPSVCRLSVTFVRFTQPVEIFRNVFIRHLVPWPSFSTLLRGG